MLTKISEPGTRLTRNRYAGDVLLEKVDPVTKEIVPTDQRNKSQSPDYVQPPYEKGYEMPTTLAGRKRKYSGF